MYIQYTDISLLWGSLHPSVGCKETPVRRGEQQGEGGGRVGEPSEWLCADKSSSTQQWQCHATTPVRTFSGVQSAYLQQLGMQD